MNKGIRHIFMTVLGHPQGNVDLLVKARYCPDYYYPIITEIDIFPILSGVVGPKLLGMKDVHENTLDFIQKMVTKAHES
jgi:hypothetical protein